MKYRIIILLLALIAASSAYSEPMISSIPNLIEKEFYYYPKISITDSYSDKNSLLFGIGFSKIQEKIMQVPEDIGLDYNQYDLNFGEIKFAINKNLSLETMRSTSFINKLSYKLVEAKVYTHADLKMKLNIGTAFRALVLLCLDAIWTI